MGEGLDIFLDIYIYMDATVFCWFLAWFTLIRALFQQLLTQGCRKPAEYAQRCSAVLTSTSRSMGIQQKDRARIETKKISSCNEVISICIFGRPEEGPRRLPAVVGRRDFWPGGRTKPIQRGPR